LHKCFELRVICEYHPTTVFCASDLHLHVDFNAEIILHYIKFLHFTFMFINIFAAFWRNKVEYIISRWGTGMFFADCLIFLQYLVVSGDQQKTNDDSRLLIHTDGSERKGSFLVHLV